MVMTMNPLGKVNILSLTNMIENATCVFTYTKILIASQIPKLTIVINVS